MRRSLLGLLALASVVGAVILGQVHDALNAITYLTRRARTYQSLLGVLAAASVIAEVIAGQAHGVLMAAATACAAGAAGGAALGAAIPSKKNLSTFRFARFSYKWVDPPL